MSKRICLAGLIVLAVLLAAGCRSRQAAMESGPEFGECPVMAGHDAQEQFRVVHEGETYHFCCAWCIEQFEADPEKYISGGTAESADHRDH